MEACLNPAWTASPRKMNRTVILLICTLCVTGCHHVPSLLKEKPKGDPVTVRVIEAVPSGRSGASSYVGKAEASRIILISAGNPGTLAELPVKAGQNVSKDQLVARIESQPIRSAHDAACSQLVQAEDAWERIKKAHGSGSVTEVQYMEIKAKVEQARAMELSTRKALWHCTLRAPFDGVVEEVFTTRGVEVELAAPLMRIVDLSSVEIHFPLPENEFLKHKTGDGATVEVPALGRILEGTLTGKGVLASSLSHSYDCVVSLKGITQDIMPGMICKVYLEIEGDESIVIPASAVRTDSRGRFVWIVSDGTVDKKYITVAGYSKDGIIASEGLQTGDMVIVEGSRKVSTGMKVIALQ